MTWVESDVNSWLHSLLSCVSGCLASDGSWARTCAMQPVNVGGSVGTITGAPGLWAV